MRKVLVLASLAFLLTRAAGALCFAPQPRLVCAEYFHSQAVVIAKLTGKRHVTPKDDMDWFIYTLQTEQVFRGKMNAAFRVYEENASGRAAFEWKIGRSYVLFLDYDKTERAWELDGCGNSAPVSAAANVLKAIDVIQDNPGDGGFIHGSVHIAGVKIVAFSKGRAFRTSSNQDGDFKIVVPAGDYRVKASSPGWSFSENDFSYERPQRVHIEKGGCAQVQFDARLLKPVP